MKLFKSLNTPNKLTLIRFFGVLVIIVLATIEYYFKQYLFIGNSSFTYIRLIIIILFLGCSYTDHLDGKLARKNNQITTFGKFADPIADKTLNNSLFIILAVNHEISIAVPLIFILRDTIVDGIRLVASEKNKVLAASILGKIKTVVQVILASYFLIGYPFFDTLSILKYIGIILEIIAILASLISGIDYLIKNKDIILEGAK